MARRSQVYARFNAPRYGRTPTLLPGAPSKTEMSLEPGIRWAAGAHPEGRTYRNSTSGVGHSTCTAARHGLCHCLWTLPGASYVDYATGQDAGESRTAIGNNKVDTARRQRSQWKGVGHSTCTTASCLLHGLCHRTGRGRVPNRHW